MTERSSTIALDVPEVEEQDRVEEAPAPASRRGHSAKIEEAEKALCRAGHLPPNLRPAERDRRIIDWLKTHGYAGDKAHDLRNDLPSPSALARYFNRRNRLKR